MEQMKNQLLTLGRVSTTYMNLAFGFDWTILFNSCSSSTQRALNPDKGWLHRHNAACIIHSQSVLCNDSPTICINSA